jgi:tRNA modification GTPase
MDTIVALSTAKGRAGVAVIRVSGSLAWQVCQGLGGRLPKPRLASVMTLRDAEGDLIDEALVLIFEDGRSFTGERLVEFQVHGSNAIIRRVLDRILSFPGVRAAEPGEFTRRAFDAGRLDLVQVEALGDLINAETEAQRKQALRGFRGDAQRTIAVWRDLLMNAMAMLTASLDFADEDLPGDFGELVRAPLQELDAAIATELRGIGVSERVRDGFRVAIVGPVNAGKSTLLNHLAGREIAITSEFAGTTRDVIEVSLDLDGLPVTIIDTAGLRETFDPVETIGIARGQQIAQDADLRIYLVDAPETEIAPLRPEDIILVAKDDHGAFENGISGVTGAGVQDLVRKISTNLVERAAEPSVFSGARQKQALEVARERLSSALDLLDRGGDCALVAEELRLAAARLEAMLGRAETEDILGLVFGRFCIGK